MIPIAATIIVTVRAQGRPAHKKYATAAYSPTMTPGVVAPADYQTSAATTPGFMVVLYAAVAYFLWAGRPWARTVTMIVAAIGIIGNLSVVLYYDHTATIAVNVVGLLLALGILILLALPDSKRYFEHST